MARPIVSVTICLHNAAGFIRATLASLFAQTCQDFEAVIVDDGSTDGSAELIEREFRDSRLAIIRQRQQTLRIARPVSIAHARGEFFAILDSDDLWAPEKLDQQIAAARRQPDAGLIFTDCELIDPSGRPFGKFSEQFDYRRIDYSAGRVHLELLRLGNFVGISTAMVPMSAMRAAGGFDFNYQYVNDYDLWLRLGRRFPFACVNEPLAGYRIHGSQFTQRHPEITLPEQVALLTPILKSASYPRDVRVAIGDNLLGQHRLAWRQLLEQGRERLSARTALGMLRYPGPILSSVRHRARGAAAVALERSIAGAHRMLRASHYARAVVQDAREHARLLASRARYELFGAPPPRALHGPTHVWVDGTSLGREQTGYFNLLSELIRRLLADDSNSVHVSATAAGRAALLARLGSHHPQLRFHAAGWRSFHWTDVFELLVSPYAIALALTAGFLALAIGVGIGSPLVALFAVAAIAAVVLTASDLLAARISSTLGRGRHTWLARLIRFAWRRWPSPRWRSHHDSIEIVFWRGRFKFKDARHLAIIQDMTTRIMPDVHTEGNVREFDEFLGYVQRHADHVLTVSHCSRRDIIERVAVSPESITVIPMPIHPQYAAPVFDAGVRGWHRLDRPYILCVGAIEPRKNLRRVVRAFELIKDEPAAQDAELIIVGPRAWDPDFPLFVAQSGVARRTRLLGYVPLEHLPTLYHDAAVVVAASVYEGFGIPVMEAMCSSAVVIAADAGSLPEVVGRDGVLFDPYNTEQIAASILAALNLTPQQREADRLRSRQRAREHLGRVAATDYARPWAPAPVPTR